SPFHAVSPSEVTTKDCSRGVARRAKGRSCRKKPVRRLSPFARRCYNRIIPPEPSSSFRAERPLPMPSDSVAGFLDRAKASRVLFPEQVEQLIRQPDIPQSDL